jgi:hydroxyethylthiazole kinase-like uncharacterized protein yjeF
MKLVSVAEMRAIEQEADANGLTYAQMMENAGNGLAKVVLSLSLAEKDESQVLGLVGPGNNGGDTLVALSHLAAQDWRARAYLIHRKAEGDPLIERLRQAGGEVVLAEKDDKFEHLAAFMETATLVLDGVLGTGIHLPLRGEIATVLNAAREIIVGMEWAPFVVAVDCPSGVDSDSGEASGQCLPADLTVTMAAVKQGLLRLPAFELVGDLQVVDIGLTEKIKSYAQVKHEVADEDMVRDILPTFGTALIVAGSVNYTGAALLAGKAAYRSGAGLVTLAVPASLHGTLAGQFPEATWLLLPHELGVISESAAEVLFKNLKRPTAMLIGPGFGMENTTRDFLKSLLSGVSLPKQGSGHIGFLHEDSEKTVQESVSLPPLVIDADGLKLLAKIENWHKLLPAPAVLTPHPGEMSVLTGLSTGEIQADRQKIASQYAKKWGHVVVLKGAFSVVANPDGRTTIIPVASAALAHAGTGDVLAGVIVGLRAQGVAAYEAAVAGAWIHGMAGLYAADALGNTASVLAGDVLAAISEVVSDIVYE